MSEPGKPTAEQPAVTPTVSTDPQPGPWHISRIPSHLGRARTSTLVLGFLFLAIGVLYLNIRPDTPFAGTATTSETGTEQQQEPVAPTTPGPGTTAEPTTGAPPTEEPGPTTAPTTGAELPTTGSPTGTTTAEPTEGTTATSFPTSRSPSAPATSSPTVVSPPG